jgi:hypothetical protein
VERKLPQIVVAFHQDVEGAELHLLIVLAAVKGIEISDAVDAEDHRLTVEYEAFLADHPSRLDDSGVSGRPVVAVAREQSHPIAVPFHAEAVSVVFHFMEPIGAAGNCRGLRRQAKLKQRTAHGGKIGRSSVFR